MLKNELVRYEGSIYRVLELGEDRVLLIDCVKKTMPKWYSCESVEFHSHVEEQELWEETKVELVPYDALDDKGKRIAHERYGLIVGILIFVGEESLRSEALARVSKENNISRRTITTYLCTYLAYQNIASLAPNQKREAKKLTRDQKNMRWALNKFYYTRHNNSLMDAFVMMLKERYLDERSELMEEHPTFNQFRYFFRQTRSLQKEYISRGGVKDYEMNHRPLLGDGIQEFAPTIGIGMVDATICDIYLCDERGNLVGRPILVACVDAHSGMCMGYSLLWEGGMYSLQELMLNVVSDKVEHCNKFGILISKEDWDCSELPYKIVSDMGSEYKSYQFEQIVELGCTLVNLPPFRPELKGQVEKLFDLVQDSYKPYLKGKGVIDVDFQKRGAHDYRKDACLTMEQFEKIILHCIIYHNTQRLLENFPYSEDMVREKVAPHANAIWNYEKTHDEGLIPITKEKLVLTLLPRCEASFSRRGLLCNKLRYQNEAYVEAYLKGGKTIVAYNPNNVGEVYLVEDDYAPFTLIESRYKGKTMEEVASIKSGQRSLVKEHEEANLKARVELAKHLEAIASHGAYSEDVKLKSIRKTRKREKDARHKDLLEVVLK